MRVLSIFLIVALLIAPVSFGFAPSDTALTPDQRIIHILNRTTFGPRTVDVARVKAIGIESYLDEQLKPASLRDERVAALLGDFKTLRMSPTEIAREYGVAAPAGDSMMMGMDRARLTPEQRQQQQRELRRKQRVLLQELTAQRLLRAAYSERQLQEVMTDFWMNHFNIYYPKGFDRILTTDFELNVIRPNALGRFEDLLVGVAKSPAMLFYLDNWLSSAPEDEVKSRIRETARKAGFRGRNQRSRRQQLQQALGPTPALFRAKGLNENYARELLELHTVGVEGGYSQADIIEVARAFTGWTITSPEAGARFHYQQVMHEEGDKVVMGRRIESSGINEGMSILKFLASHPSTARFIAHKLAVRFVADDPPEAIVGEAERAFQRSGGDISAVLKAIFTSPHFYSPEVYRAKAKKPFELVISTARALDADIRNPRFLAASMGEMGERLYLQLTPDGYPDESSAWINTNSLLVRLNFAMAMASGQVRGVRVDPAAGEELFKLLELPEPNPEQRARTAELIAANAPGSRQLAKADLVVATAFKLGSPTFQKR